MRAQKNLPPNPARGGAPRALNASVQTAQKNETAEVLDAGPIQSVPTDNLGVRDGQSLGSVVSGEPGKRRRQWIVARDAKITTSTGLRSDLRFGKIIDGTNYDIKGLIRQGVRLREIKDGEDADDVRQQMMEASLA